MIRHRLIIAAVVAAVGYGFIAFDSWSTGYLDTHASARAFVLTPAFTVAAIGGAIIASLCAFGALAFILFPRPSGRPELEDHNQ